ncbi:MAG: NADH-quinone oxidoreductase subunit I [Pseudomonadota bacterium]
MNAHDSPPGAMRIPCLGGLRESRLLGLARHAGGAPVQLLDRGACGDCPANPGGRHPAADTVASVHQWLEWLDPSAPERIEITPSPAKHALAREIPGPEAHRPVSRRGFLRALQGELDHALNQAERATSTTAGEAAPVDGHARIHPRERMSFLVELVHAAKRAGTDFPSARLFPRIHVTSDCRNDNLCAALCPTAALKPYRDHADAGLQFDAAACIQCQACESACPHAALSLTWEPPDAQVPCWQEPTRHTTRICTQCDTHFVDSGHADDELPVCPACRRSQAFARAGFETLFRHATTRVG